MKTKIISLIVIIILFAIIVLQNTGIIPINIFFWQLKMSTIVLIFLVFLIGLIAGFIISRIFDSPSKKGLNKKGSAE